MRSTKCKKCGAEISIKLQSCPQCGAKVTYGWTPYVTMFVVFFLIPWVFVTIATKNDEKASAPTDKSPEMQGKREGLINKLQKQGLFGKVECRGGGGDLWVTPAFMSLPFDDKMSFASLVHAYCIDDSYEYASISLKDDLTAKSVGLYSKQQGLKLE